MVYLNPSPSMDLNNTQRRGGKKEWAGFLRQYKYELQISSKLLVDPDCENSDPEPDPDPDPEGLWRAEWILRADRSGYNPSTMTYL